ncbi:hypothetical protein D5S17_14475 [Pseudonocardiaceae bacterium YIM PH 21723]|nr:hypothetical protein D5S17_14475 [Pseudonocardiaceae bacterium YIM PH 21723]
MLSHILNPNTIILAVTALVLVLWLLAKAARWRIGAAYMNPMAGRMPGRDGKGWLILLIAVVGVFYLLKTGGLG